MELENQPSCMLKVVATNCCVKSFKPWLVRSVARVLAMPQRAAGSIPGPGHLSVLKV